MKINTGTNATIGINKNNSPADRDKKDSLAINTADTLDEGLVKVILSQKTEQKPELDALKIQSNKPDTKESDPKKSKTNNFEMISRYTNDIVLQLGISDLSSSVALLSHVIPIPPALASYRAITDTINLGANLFSGAEDVRQIHGVFKNKDATKLDRVVDVAHFAASDVIATAAGVIPLFTSLSNPVMMGLFVGGQLLGIGADIAKTAYDIHRKGQQSVHKD